MDIRLDPGALELFDYVPSKDVEKEADETGEDVGCLLVYDAPTETVYFTDSEDEEATYLCGRTKEEADKIWHKYFTQVRESEGFDVDLFPGPYAPYIPYPDFKDDEEDYECVKAMARQALQSFKDKSGKQYELVDAEKIVRTTSLLYFITFKAKQLRGPSASADNVDTDDVVKTMQAVVLNRFTKFEVQSCRIKPTN